MMDTTFQAHATFEIEAMKRDITKEKGRRISQQEQREVGRCKKMRVLNIFSLPQRVNNLLENFIGLKLDSLK